MLGPFFCIDSWSLSWKMVIWKLYLHSDNLKKKEKQEKKLNAHIKMTLKETSENYDQFLSYRFSVERHFRFCVIMQIRFAASNLVK